VTKAACPEVTKGSTLNPKVDSLPMCHLYLEHRHERLAHRVDVEGEVVGADL
jgi:hypothetical protein